MKPKSVCCTQTEFFSFFADGKCKDCNEGAALGTGVGIGVVITVLLVAVVGFFLYRRRSGWYYIKGFFFPLFALVLLSEWKVTKEGKLKWTEVKQYIFLK